MYGVGNEFPANHSLQGVASNNEFVEVEFRPNYHWKVIYFYPKDFTFICPTEIAAMDKIAVETDAHVIGISGDNEFCKLAWKNDNEMIANIHHTLAADCGLYLSDDLGIIDHQNGVCYRATYIVDPDNIIQHVSVNALDTGRNADEVLRTLQALRAGGLTGCSWQEGEDFVA